MEKNKMNNNSMMKNFLILNLGCIIAAIPAVFFFSKVNIPPGGLYSVALLTYNALGLCGDANNLISSIAIMYNIPLLVAAYYVFGLEYLLKVVYASFAYPIYIMVINFLFASVVANYVPSLYTAILLGGVVMGVGVALTIYSGANTGGTDILGQVLNKYVPRISLGLSIGLFNLIILAASLFILGASGTLYGIAVVIIVAYLVYNFLVNFVG